MSDKNPFKPLSLRVHLSNRGLMGVGSALTTSLNIERDPMIMHVRGCASCHVEDPGSRQEMLA